MQWEEKAWLPWLSSGRSLLSRIDPIVPGHKQYLRQLVTLSSFSSQYLLCSLILFDSHLCFVVYLLCTRCYPRAHTGYGEEKQRRVSYFVSPKTEDGSEHEQDCVVPGYGSETIIETITETIITIIAGSRRDIYISPQETRGITQEDFDVKITHKWSFERLGERIDCREDRRRRGMGLMNFVDQEWLPTRRRG